MLKVILFFLFFSLSYNLSFAKDIDKSFFEEDEEEVAQMTSSTTIIQNDPLEKLNRKTFCIYQKFDLMFLDPLAKLYNSKIPRTIQNGIRNIGTHYGEPITAVNATIAMNSSEIALSLNRFFMNMFFGFAGLDDVASKMDINKSRLAFADVLRMLKIPDGPYFISPFGGMPGSVIDGANFAQGILFSPYDFSGYKLESINRLRVVAFVTATRADLDGIIDNARATSVDLYLTQRAFYFANKLANTQQQKKELEQQKQNQLNAGTTFVKQMRIKEEYFI